MTLLSEDDITLYEALKRVHLLPQDEQLATREENPFANLDTFVAAGETKSCVR